MVRHIAFEDICVFIRETNELFSFILWGPPLSEHLPREVRLMRACSRQAFSSGQKLKGADPLIKPVHVNSQIKAAEMSNNKLFFNKRVIERTATFCLCCDNQ